jgi:hypothetical protein
MAYIMIERHTESAKNEDKTRRWRFQRSEHERFTSETANPTNARISADIQQQFFGVNATHMQNNAAKYRRHA